MGARSNIFGTFCATGSDVILMNDASLTGAIYAKIVKVGKYSTIMGLTQQKSKNRHRILESIEFK